jgi:hypothetical protein
MPSGHWTALLQFFGETTMVYTTQRDRHWNMIVCKGDRERDGYRIIYTGSYNACLAVKANGGAL